MLRLSASVGLRGGPRPSVVPLAVHAARAGRGAAAARSVGVYPAPSITWRGARR